MVRPVFNQVIFSAELSRISSESAARTQLEMHRKDKLAKEEHFKRLITKNEDNMKYLLGNVPASGFKQAVDAYIGYVL